MYLESIRLTEIRNFQNLKLNLRPKINFFLGENGQGKTNIIEAIYFLCRGNSFRSTESLSVIRKDFLNKNKTFLIDMTDKKDQEIFKTAKINGNFKNENLGYEVEVTFQNKKKSAEINGKSANSGTLMSKFPVVLFSPESLSAIKDGPDQRRQLVDEVLLNHEPRHGKLIREFTQALRSRNRLLRNLRENVGSKKSNLDSLESLNKIYFIIAAHFTSARIQALNAIQPHMTEAMRYILDEPDADISVDYLISGNSAMHWDQFQIFDALHKRYQDLNIQEITSGTSLIGPHKHDVKLLLSGNDSRFYCSQGQQRALILALKIAQIVYHHEVHKNYPILLLDDVMSELDVKKRLNLINFLEGISAQILITATDLTWSDQFELDRNSIYSVSKGVVSPMGA